VSGPREKGEALARELGGTVEFLGFDLDEPAALRAALEGLDSFFTCQQFVNE
jgi:uncharacterized protein YbjT (DUF2867 family)